MVKFSRRLRSHTEFRDDVPEKTDEQGSPKRVMNYAIPPPPPPPPPPPQRPVDGDDEPRVMPEPTVEECQHEPEQQQEIKNDVSSKQIMSALMHAEEDPALLVALQEMLGQQPTVDEDRAALLKNHRETLMLAAESLLEKKAAHEALERARLAESRLQESLKRCAPELTEEDDTTSVAKFLTNTAKLVVEEDALNDNSGNKSPTSNQNFLQRLARHRSPIQTPKRRSSREAKERREAGQKVRPNRRLYFGKARSRDRKPDSTPKQDVQLAPEELPKEDTMHTANQNGSSEAEESQTPSNGNQGQHDIDKTLTQAFDEAIAEASNKHMNNKLHKKKHSKRNSAKTGESASTSQSPEVASKQEPSGRTTNTKHVNKYKHIHKSEPKVIILCRSKSLEDEQGSSQYSSSGSESSTASSRSSSSSSSSSSESSTGDERTFDGTLETHPGSHLLEIEGQDTRETMTIDEDDSAYSMHSEEEDSESEDESEDDKTDDEEDDDDDKTIYTLFELESKCTRSVASSTLASHTDDESYERRDDRDDVDRQHEHDEGTFEEENSLEEHQDTYDDHQETYDEHQDTYDENQDTYEEHGTYTDDEALSQEEDTGILETDATHDEAVDHQDDKDATGDLFPFGSFWYNTPSTPCGASREKPQQSPRAASSPLMEFMNGCFFGGADDAEGGLLLENEIPRRKSKHKR